MVLWGEPWLEDQNQILSQVCVWGEFSGYHNMSRIGEKNCQIAISWLGKNYRFDYSLCFTNYLCVTEKDFTSSFSAASD